MAVYNVTLLSVDNFEALKGLGETLYEGDDMGAAQAAGEKAFLNRANQGRTIRFYDFHLFGGGMKDTIIKDQP